MSTQEANEKAEARREANRRYYAANREKGKARAKAWRANNSERAKAVASAYKKANGRRMYQKTKQARNKWHAQYQKTKAERDENFRIRRWICFRMNAALQKHHRGGNVTKASRIVQLLGCDWKEFVSHVESQFQPGMSWDNHSQSGWHFDHIAPLSSFDLTDEAQLKKACHFTNVQPLWAADNVRKGAKVA
jgi:hypothetical protein